MDLNFLNRCKFSISIEDSSLEENVDGWTQTVKVQCEYRGELIGESQFQWNPDQRVLFPDLASVVLEFRRKGIATKLYCLAEERTNSKIIRPDDHSYDAERFWDQPNRTFGISY